MDENMMAKDVSFNGINRISVKKNVNGQKLQTTAEPAEWHTKD